MNLKQFLEQVKFGYDFINVFHGSDNSIIFIKSIEKFDNFAIVFDGEQYYLVDSEMNMVAKDKDRNKIIPKGVIEQI